MVNERRILWIITVVVVDDTFRYLAREVIGNYSNRSPGLAISGTLHTDSCDVRRDVQSASRRPTGRALSARATSTPASTSACLALSASATFMGTALLTSGNSTGGCHRCLVNYV